MVLTCSKRRHRMQSPHDCRGAIAKTWTKSACTGYSSTRSRTDSWAIADRRSVVSRPRDSRLRSPVSLQAVSLSELCFHWPPTSSSRRSLRFAARKRSPANNRIPHSGQRCRRWPEWGMRRLVGGFDPSLEPLRPMGQAHRGVPKVRRPLCSWEPKLLG